MTAVLIVIKDIEGRVRGKNCADVEARQLADHYTAPSDHVIVSTPVVGSKSTVNESLFANVTVDP